MLETTIESVNSALKRARSSLERRPSLAECAVTRATASLSEDVITSKFVSAWESADLDARGASNGRRLHLNAPDTIRIRRSRSGCPLLCQHLRGGQEVRPCSHASERSTGVWRLPALPQQSELRSRSLRPHLQGRQDRCHDAVREYRVPVVRVAAIPPEPIAGPRKKLSQISSDENIDSGFCEGSGDASMVSEGTILLVTRERWLRWELRLNFYHRQDTG